MIALEAREGRWREGKKRSKVNGLMLVIFVIQNDKIFVMLYYLGENKSPTCFVLLRLNDAMIHKKSITVLK